MAALFLSLLFAVWPAHASRVTDIRAEGGSLVVQFDDQVESASIFGLEGPDRLAIDIDGASADDLGARDLAFGHLRGGQFDADTARIVLDLDRPVTVLDLRFAADGRSLTIELAKAVNERGIFVVGFSFPVIPKGEARIRVQLSAAHTREQLDMALSVLGDAGNSVGAI